MGKPVDFLSQSGKLLSKLQISTVGVHFTITGTNMALFGDVRMYKDVALISPEHVERSILLIRGQKVILSTDLAELPAEIWSV